MISLPIRSKLREAVREKRTLKESRHIFLIDDITVAKKYWDKKRAQKDFKYGELLHANGIIVPEYYGIIVPDYRLIREFYGTPLYHWYLIMERINGVSPRDVEENDLELFTSLHRSQLEKALSLGVRPQNLVSIDNSIFDKERSLVYLINFGSWRNGQGLSSEFSKENLDRLYSQMRR